MLIMSKPSCIFFKKIVFYYRSSFKDGGTWMGLILLQSQSRYINFSTHVIVHVSIDFLRVNGFTVEGYLLFYIPLKKWRRDVTGLQDLLKGTWNFISPLLKIGKLNRYKNFLSIFIKRDKYETGADQENFQRGGGMRRIN